MRFAHFGYGKTRAVKPALDYFCYSEIVKPEQFEQSLLKSWKVFVLKAEVFFSILIKKLLSQAQKFSKVVLVIIIEH